jgi:hypothetical protein
MDHLGLTCPGAVTIKVAIAVITPCQLAVRRHAGQVLVEVGLRGVGLEEQLPEVLVVAATESLGQRSERPALRARARSRRP